MALRNTAAGYLTTGYANLPTTNSSQSICFWFNVGSYPGGNAGWLNIVSLGSSAAIQIGSRSSTMLVWRWGGVTLVTAGSNPTVNVTHSLVYTTNGTTQNLYIDGVLSNSNTTSNGNGAVDSVQIFGNQWSENISVTLEDIRVYSRVLTAAEVLTYHTCRGSDAILNNLMSYWKLSEGPVGTNPPSGTAIRDFSNSGNNGLSFTDSNTNYTYQDSFLKNRKISGPIQSR